MDIKGFNLLLQDFCEYCPDFDVEIEKRQISKSWESCVEYQTNIRCKNRKRCAKIAETIERHIKNGL